MSAGRESGPLGSFIPTALSTEPGKDGKIKIWRKKGGSIFINDNITILIVEVEKIKGNVRIGLEAPAHQNFVREEVIKRKETVDAS